MYFVHVFYERKAARRFLGYLGVSRPDPHGYQEHQTEGSARHHLEQSRRNKTYCLGTKIKIDCSQLTR